MTETGLNIFPIAIGKLEDVSCYELFSSDTLHCIWIRVFMNLIGLILGVLKKHEPVDHFNST